MKTWLLIADAGHARILETDGVGKPLIPVPGLDLNQALPRSHDLGSERPGRSHESVGSGRHAIEPRVDPHRKLKHAFAGHVADVLDRAAAAHAFDRLVVAAPPGMLGDLRAAVDQHTAGKIAAELPKDLVKVPDHELREHFATVLAF